MTYRMTSFEPATKKQIRKWITDISTKCLIQDGKVFIKTRSDYTNRFSDTWDYAGDVKKFFWSNEYGMDAGV